MKKSFNEMTAFERRMTICIEEWAELTETEEFLDYAEGLDLSGMATENGERVFRPNPLNPEQIITATESRCF